MLHKGTNILKDRKQLTKHALSIKMRASFHRLVAVLQPRGSHAYSEKSEASTEEGTRKRSRTSEHVAPCAVARIIESQHRSAKCLAALPVPRPVHPALIEPGATAACEMRHKAVNLKGKPAKPEHGCWLPTGLLGIWACQRCKAQRTRKRSPLPVVETSGRLQVLQML